MLSINEILIAISNADLENKEEIIVDIKDLKTIKRKILNLEKEINSLKKENKILRNTIIGIKKIDSLKKLNEMLYK